MSLSSFVARIGSNVQFIAFNAHWGVTFAVMAFVLHAFPWINFDLLGALVLTAAAVKEFYFDAKYELDQTFINNFEDWMGYAAGVLILWLYRLA